MLNLQLFRMVPASAALSLLFASLLASGWSLKHVQVEVPRYKLRGDLAVLECNYELEGDNLYALKWYKENEEFYRYIPRSNPPKMSYPVQGIKVDMSTSTSSKVVLRNVNLKTSGLYRCEVSAEAPSFSSAAAEAPMTVIFIPASGPHIAGERKRYVVGDEVNLNCTSGKSYPASVLYWFINDHMVRDEEGLIRYPTQVHQHGLLTTTLGLRLRVQPHHYLEDTMRLRCVASLSPVFWTNEESVIPERNRNREALFMVKGRGVRCQIQVIVLLISIASIVLS